MNFQLTRDQVVHLETAANLGASRRQAKKISAVFFLFFELGGITEHLMTGPREVVTFVFPSLMFPSAVLTKWRLVHTRIQSY